MKTFNEKCYDLLKKIPSGKVTTYQQIARELGSNASRAVGTAMKKNTNGPVVPCHRVIKSNGEVGFFNGGEDLKYELLRSEGIEIINGKIDLEKYLFKF